MLKLYKRVKDVLRYHEAWCHDGTITQHWGIVGERGESCERKLPKKADEAQAILDSLRSAAVEGFRPIDKLTVLQIEYRVDGFGTRKDLDKRFALQDRMNETLGWTSLGHCDGGSIGSGTMEVCCLVVDFDIATRVIAADLEGTEFGDFTRIYREDSRTNDSAIQES